MRKQLAGMTLNDATPDVSANVACLGISAYHRAGHVKLLLRGYE